MEEIVFDELFMGNIGLKLQAQFAYGDLQMAMETPTLGVRYILRGDLALIAACESFIRLARSGTLTYDETTHVFSVVGLDGTTAEISIFSEDDLLVADLEDEFALTAGAGSYNFEIPIAGQYRVVVWGTTKCAVLQLEIS